MTPAEQLAAEMQEEIKKRAAIFEQRIDRLVFVLGQPIESDVHHQMMILLADRALIWTYLVLAQNKHQDAYAECFYSCCDLLDTSISDATHQSGAVPDAIARMDAADAHVDAIEHSAYKESNDFIAALAKDDQTRTLGEFVCIVRRGYLNYVTPVALPPLIMHCTTLTLDLNLEAKGVKIPNSKIALGRSELRATIAGIFREVKPLIDAGRLVFKDGKLVPAAAHH